MLRKVTISVTLCLLACLRGGAQDRSTPEATVRSFLAALERADIRQAAACVKGAQSSPAFLDAIAQQVQKDPVTITLSDAKTTLKDTSAVFTGQVSLKAKSSDRAQTGSTELTLASSGGAWQIVPNAEKALHDGRDIVNAMAYVLTDAKVFSQARDAARATACLSNVKQLCLGAMMLMQDYDDTFKLKADTYKKSLMPYVKKADIFKCPADTGSGVSYSFNANLAGVSDAKVRAPAETVLIYEGRNGKLDFRHDGKAVVGFADGHAKLVNAEGAKKLRWRP